MNILFLNYVPVIPYMGGVQRVTESLAREFQKEGHSVLFLYYAEEEEKYDYVTYCKQLFLKVENKMSDDIVVRWKSILKEYSITHIINQIPDNCSLNLLNKTPSNIKTVTVLHNQVFPTSNKLKKMLALQHTPTFKSKIRKSVGMFFPSLVTFFDIEREKRLLKRVFTSSDKVCVLAEASKERIKEFMGNVYISKVMVIGNPNSFETVRNNYVKNKTIVFVGRLENTQKNVFSFIDVWNILQQNNQDWHAQIIGDGPDMSDLQKYARQKKVQRLEFKGYIKDVTPYYEKASILCLTSTYEAWGMCVVEAMQYRCVPIVFNTYEAASTIIENNKSGYLIEDMDVEKMASAAQKLIDSPELLSKMGDSAMVKSDEFSSDRIAKEWINNLEQIV